MVSQPKEYTRACQHFQPATQTIYRKNFTLTILYKTYSAEEYPKYDNYDAIEVATTRDIPVDFDGVMGVPVTFLEKYNPEQFEILGNGSCYAPDGYSLISELFVNGSKKFKRLLIRKKNQSNSK